MTRDIFYPEDRVGYETDADRAAAYSKIQADALSSFPGAGGDLVIALSMTVRHLESIIRGAKARLERG